MRCRLNQGFKYRYQPGMETPLSSSSPVVVVIDPSKSNLAGLIVTHSNEPLLEFELSGNDKDILQETMDTTEYCEAVSMFIKEVTAAVEVTHVFIEQHILSKGNDYYNSMTVLTEIRTHLIILSTELTGRKAIEINNMKWKGAILPDGYRGHKEKGSHRFLSQIDARFRDYSDDMTDCYCIKEYAFRYILSTQEIKCVSSERADYAYTIKIVDRDDYDLSKGKWFAYNNAFSLEENAIYYLNRSSAPGVCELRNLSVEDIYKYAEELHTQSQPVLLVYK